MSDTRKGTGHRGIAGDAEAAHKYRLLQAEWLIQASARILAGEDICIPDGPVDPSRPFSACAGERADSDPGSCPTNPDSTEHLGRDEGDDATPCRRCEPEFVVTEGGPVRVLKGNCTPQQFVDLKKRVAAEGLEFEHVDVEVHEGPSTASDKVKDDTMGTEQDEGT